MTVCIAAIYDRSCIVGASDRMLTSGDVQFEPETPKQYGLTHSIMLLVAGDMSINAEVAQATRQRVRQRIDADPDTWVSVASVVEDYTQSYAEARNRRAVRALLTPLGLHLESFRDLIASSQSTVVSDLAREFLNYRVPTIGGIVAGIDNSGPHIYAGSDGRLNCEDAVGFAAIGAGSWHASSQLMFARYTNTAAAAKALYLVYAAKKRAETAPGVGEATDMFHMGPDLGTSVPISPNYVNDLDSMYQQNVKEIGNIYARTERTVDEYINAMAQRARDSARPADQAGPSNAGEPLPPGATRPLDSGETPATGE